MALTACKFTVSGSISLPSRGAFHQFPHGTRSLSVAISYLGLEGGPPRFRQDFSCPAVLRILLALSIFRLRDFHPLRFAFPDNSARSLEYRMQSYNPINAETIMVWPNPRSFATTKGISFDFFSSGYLDGSVPQVSLRQPMYSVEYVRYQSDGLLHSDTRGSTNVCFSPRLFAAYRVLHRQIAPRHSP